MRKSRKFALVASACMTMLALAIAGTVGVLNVYANGDLSSTILVEQFEPVGDFGTELVNIYTEGGTLPPTLPFEVETDVDLDNSSLEGEIQQISKVEMSLNGTLDVASSPPTLTDADQIVAAVQFDEEIDRGVPTSEIFTEWGGILDLSLSAFEPYTFALGAKLRTLAKVRTLVTVEETTTEVRASTSGFSEFDEGTLDVVIFDAAEALVDINDNDKPDSQGLTDHNEGILIGTGPSGGQVISVWNQLSPFSRQFSLGEVGLVLESAAGAIFVDVTAPSLAALTQAGSIYDIYNDGRLVLSVAGTPADLLDGPLGVNPLGEFNLTESARAPGDPLPAPVNIFALVNILLRDVPIVGPPSPWLALKNMPSGEMIDAEISGPGVEAFLATLPGGEAFGYTYSTTNTVGLNGAQTDFGDEAGWQEVTVTLSATSRATISAGDNTVSLSLASASVIAGSNATPPTTTLRGGGGGGGGGTCFIATAAYGTPLADDINVLRALRDSYLLNNAAGAAFVDTYYRLSPPVADAVANNALLRAAVRTLLAPLVILGSFVMAMPGASLLLLFACVALAVSRIRRRMTRV